MSVPKTSVDEYGPLSTDPRNIWIAGDIFAVEAVARIAYLAQQRSNKQLGRGIFAFDAPHRIAALFVAEVVSQMLSAGSDQTHAWRRSHYIYP